MIYYRYKDYADMQEINEYSANTSDYELCSFFYDRIISGEIKTFSALTAVAQPVF